MPDIYPSSGFNLGALPQYNPIAADNFVRNPVAAIPAFQEGVKGAGNLVAFAPEINNRIAQARLETAHALSQIPLQQSLADAQAATAKATKAQADYTAQNLQNRAQLLQIVHGLSAGAALGGLTNNAQITPPRTTAQNDTNNTAASIAAQPAALALGAGANMFSAAIPAITALSQFSGQAPTAQAPGSGALNPNSTTRQIVQPTAPQAPAIQQQQKQEVAQQVAQVPSTFVTGTQAISPESSSGIEKLWQFLPDEQRLDMIQNVAAYNASPLEQAKTQQVYADTFEKVNHGKYYDAWNDLRQAQTSDLLTSGGKYGANQAIVNGLKSAGGDWTNAVDWEAYRNHVKENPNDQVTPFDFITPKLMKAEQQRVDKLQDKRATKAGDIVLGAFTQDGLLNNPAEPPPPKAPAAPTVQGGNLSPTAASYLGQ